MQTNLSVYMSQGADWLYEWHKNARLEYIKETDSPWL